MMICFQGFTSFMIIFFFVVGGPAGSMCAAGGDNNPPILVDELVRQAAGYGEEKLSTVVVSGNLLCHSSYLDTTNSHPIPGASVSVLCHTNMKKKISKSNWVRGKTDEYGDFLIDLPSHLHAIPNLENKCVVVILGVPKKSPCHRSTTVKGKGKGKYTRGRGMIKLSSSSSSSSSSGNGIRTYSTHGILLTHKHSHPHPLKKGRKMVHT